MRILDVFSNPGKMFWVAKRIGFADRWKDETYLKWMYRAYMDCPLDLEKPCLFSEKMQWLKIHDRNPNYVKMVDKYLAKEYVKTLAGGGFIIKTLGVWDTFDQIDFDLLPNKFVLKCTHDSGGLVICKDKTKLNISEAKSKIERCLNYNFFEYGREWPYKNVKPRIIAEEYLENDESEGLHDYKIWCFNGEPIYIQYISGRIGEKTEEGFFDTNWNMQSFTYHNPLLTYEVKKPDRLDEMLQFARIFAKDIPFIRVDVYVLEDGTIKFGELTFYPMSGLQKFHPLETDKTFGDMLDITKGGKK